MTLPYKLLALLVGLLAAFGGGYYYGSGQVVTNTVTQKGDTVTVTKDHVITQIVETHADGTSTTTTKTEEVSTNQKSQTSEVSRNVSPGAASGPNYRLGAQYWVGSISDVTKGKSDQLGITGSRRLLGPVWLDGEVRPFGDKKEVAVGASVQF